MQRRNILIGIGSVAVGGIAALGGNAFNVARADRRITVQTVGDQASYLTLVPTSAYAEYDDNNMLRLAFDGSTDDQNGAGFSEDATFVFTDVFEIRNEGQEPITVTLSETLDDLNWETNFPRAYYTYDPLGTTNDREGDGEFTGDVDEDDTVLDPGHGLLVHFEFVGREADDRMTDTEEPETISIYAEAIENDD